MKKTNRSHVMAMHQLFHVIKPSESWDGLLEFLFEITGMLDANFAAHVENHKSMSGWGVFLNSAPVQEKSQQQIV